MRPFFVFDLAAMRGSEAIEPQVFTRVMGRDSPEAGHVAALFEAGGAAVRGRCTIAVEAGAATVDPSRIAFPQQDGRGRLAFVDEDDGTVLMATRRDGLYRPVGNVLDVYDLASAVSGAASDTTFPIELVTDGPWAAGVVGESVGLDEGSVCDLRRLGGPVAMTRRQVVETVVSVAAVTAAGQTAYNDAMRKGTMPADTLDDHPPQKLHDLLWSMRVRGPEQPPLPTIPFDHDAGAAAG